MRILKIIFLLISLAASGQESTQKAFHKQFTKEDGIKIETIKAIAFDNNGFIWIGGGIFKGRLELLGESNPTTLQRFNGDEFHTIPLPNNDISSIQHIYKRKDGTLLITTEQSLYLFDPITIEFTTITTPENTALSQIFNYNEKEYIITQEGLDVIVNSFDTSTSLKEVFRFKTKVNKIYIDSKTQFRAFKDYCILSDDNFPITFVDWEGKVLKTINPEGFDNERASDIKKQWIDGYWTENSEHYFLLNNDPKIYKLSKNSMDFAPLTNTKGIERNNLETHNDSLGAHVIISYNEGDLNIQSLQDESKLNTLFSNSNFNTISSFNLVSDNLSKDLWFTTATTLNYIKLPPKAITTHLPDVEFRGMASLDENQHLIGTENKGQFLFNSKTNTISTYSLYNNGQLHLLSSARNFIKDGPTLWTTDYSGVIVAIDTASHDIVQYKHYPPTCLVKTTDSTLVYGTNNYFLMEFNTQSKTHRPLLKTDSLSINDILWKKEDNHIVASTNKGLLTYNLDTNSHTFYNDPAILEDPYLLMMDYHPKYGYLIGSRSGTLYSFDLKTASFKTVYQDELNAAIATILFDDKENIWIHTFNGYVCYNPENKKVDRFSVNDGFSNNEANRFSALKTKHGFLVGTIKGLNFFKPTALQPEKRKEQIIPLRIRTFDVKEDDFVTNYQQIPFTSSQVITLPAENRTLELSFGLNSVDITRNERYRYRLNAQDWTPLGSSQSIRFPNLAPGNYDLEIEALDFSGKKIGESLILPIRAKNFFYKTWWFFVLTTLVIAGILIWMLRQAQLRKQLQENFSQDLMQSQEEERARIAKDLHDSVGQQLTLIKRRLQEKGDTSISELTHKTLEDVRHISRNLYPAILKQLGLSGSIEQLLYDLDEQTDLFVSADIDDIDDLFDEKAALHIYRFIQENVSNVMKHAFAKAVSVTLQQEEKTIRLTIKDNGKGFDVLEKQKNNSLGLKTLYERIRILEGTLTLESNTETGTLTTALIPYSYAKN